MEQSIWGWCCCCLPHCSQGLLSPTLQIPPNRFSLWLFCLWAFDIWTIVSQFVYTMVDLSTNQKHPKKVHSLFVLTSVENSISCISGWPWTGATTPSRVSFHNQLAIEVFSTIFQVLESVMFCSEVGWYNDWSEHVANVICVVLDSEH